ncbi:MAG TPA: hypothetical protein VHR67_09960 [Aestuariivirgaceae bacterium]|nr:hypothetical protein [Aestuariivirgaceae bacterium]
MGIFAKSELFIAGCALALCIAIPEASAASRFWPFDGLFGSLGSAEQPASRDRRHVRARPRSAAQQVATVEPENAVDCEKAQLIVADYGFKDIKAESCSGETLGFSATRDGKPFSIRILAADGEFAEVKRLQ